MDRHAPGAALPIAHADPDPFARFLVEGGALVGGAAVLFSGALFVGAKVVNDIAGREYFNAKAAAERGAELGTVFGFAYYLMSRVTSVK